MRTVFRLKIDWINIDIGKWEIGAGKIKHLMVSPIQKHWHWKLQPFCDNTDIKMDGSKSFEGKINVLAMRCIFIAQCFAHFTWSSYCLFSHCSALVVTQYTSSVTAASWDHWILHKWYFLSFWNSNHRLLPYPYPYPYPYTDMFLFSSKVISWK